MRLLILIFCMMHVLTLSAHEGHSHGAPLAVSVAFDASGKLWRASTDGAFVFVDFSTDNGLTFSKPVKLNKVAEKVGADGDARPKLALGPEGNIYVTWTQALAKPYSGHIRFSRSVDAGNTFSPPVVVNKNLDEITHRFDALAVAANGRVYVAWVDKRDLLAAKAAKVPYDGAAIYFASSDDAGLTFSVERKVADYSCECCRIAMITDTNNNAVAMWRHLYEGGVRDHAIARFAPQGDIITKRASSGGWKIDACPHHGPALALGQKQGVVWGYHMAWFDGEGSNFGKPGLYYSRMDGDAWVSVPPKRMGMPEQQAGHPSLLSVDEQVYLAWKEVTATEHVLMLMQSSDGGRTWDKPTVLSASAGASDHPQLLQKNNQVYVSWNTRNKATKRNEYRLIPIGEH